MSGPVIKRGRPTRYVCDGTTADYKRHLRRGEKACPASKRAWRIHHKKLRGTTKGSK